MAAKELHIEGIGPVSIYKKKGVRYVRLSIRPSGGVRVTMPKWLPYRIGIEFIEKKRDWIAEHSKPVKIISDGQKIGKEHRLKFLENARCSKPTVRVVGNIVLVKLPSGVDVESDAAQTIAEKGIIKALKIEAERLLPPRLEELAEAYGFSYQSVKIRQLKSRWGSCSSKQEITLNCFLMQLPWHLIDYVILHELTHTKVLAHGPGFWEEMSKYIADIKEVRKEMRQYQAQIV